MRRALLAVLTVALAPPASAQECLRRSEGAEVEQKLRDAGAAFVELDIPAFQLAVQQAGLLVPCLDDSVTPTLAAHTHRMKGVQLFTDGHTERAVPALAAARALEPSYRFPTEMFPEGHDLRVSYEGLGGEGVPTTRLPRPRDGVLSIDGTPGRRVPDGHPYVFQLHSEDGVVLQTAYVSLGEAPPRFPFIPPARDALWVTSAASAGAAAALYGGAWVSRAQFYGDAPSDRRDLEQARARTNGMFAASVVLSSAAVGTAIAALAL